MKNNYVEHDHEPDGSVDRVEVRVPDRSFRRTFRTALTRGLRLLRLRRSLHSQDGLRDEVVQQRLDELDAVNTFGAKLLHQAAIPARLQRFGGNGAKL